VPGYKRLLINACRINESGIFPFFLIIIVAVFFVRGLGSEMLWFSCVYYLINSSEAHAAGTIFSVDKETEVQRGHGVSIL
jgi:hypothetical protein